LPKYLSNLKKPMKSFRTFKANWNPFSQKLLMIRRASSQDLIQILVIKSELTLWIKIAWMSSIKLYLIEKIRDFLLLFPQIHATD
jgi:hypothetical protein